MSANITPDIIYSWLSEVMDPEIPVLSLLDLGVISSVRVQQESVAIEITPTFVGCPALDVMKTEIKQVLLAHGVRDVQLEVSYRQPWTSDRISEKGKKALKEFGLAPPPAAPLFTDLEVLEYAECPRCGNRNTELRSPFGPTLCRSIHYCNDCREAFEQFKPL